MSKTDFKEFKCDWCGKATMRPEDHTDKSYPYDEGWVYLHDIDYKLRRGTPSSVKDKHFCCVPHMIYSINDVITKEEVRRIVEEKAHAMEMLEQK